MTCPHVRGGIEGTQWCSLNGPGDANQLRSWLEDALQALEAADGRPSLAATKIRRELAEGTS